MTVTAPGPLRRRSLLGVLLVVPVLVGLVVAVVLLGLAPAGDADNANGSVPVTSTDALQGRWTAINAVGAPAALVADVELVVEGDRLLARTGCNTGSGTVHVEDSRLRLDDDGLAVTEMGCDPSRTRQEEWVVEMLRSAPGLDRSGPYLYLTWEAGARYWLALIPRLLVGARSVVVGRRAVSGRRGSARARRARR